MLQMTGPLATISLKITPRNSVGSLKQVLPALLLNEVI